MKNLAKKVSVVVCCAILVFSLNTTAFAANISNSNKLTKLLPSEQSEIKPLENTTNGSIAITDRKQIEKIAKQQNLNDPDSITKITYDFRDSSKIQENQLTNVYPNMITSTTVVYNVKNLGTGFSYWDNYDSSIYDGPANVTKTYSRTNSISYTCNVNVNADIVAAAVGFSIGKNQTVTESYSFTVPTNHQIELRVFTNYQEKSFDVGDDLGGLLYYSGSGLAFKPVGLIFQQIQR